MQYEPRKVLVITVDGQLMFLEEGSVGAAEMQAFRHAAQQAGATNMQVGMGWVEESTGVVVCADPESPTNFWYEPLLQPFATEQLFGKIMVSDGSTNPRLVAAVAQFEPDLIVVQGRYINDCAANTACGLRRELRKLGQTPDMVLAIDSGCIDPETNAWTSDFSNMYRVNPYCDVPRLVAMREIVFDDGGITIPEPRPRGLRRLDAALLPIDAPGS